MINFDKHVIAFVTAIAAVCGMASFHANAAAAANSTTENVAVHSPRAMALANIRAYRPPVRVRSQYAERDAKKLVGAPTNLRRYVPTYVGRELARTKMALDGNLPADCLRRMFVFVQRIDDRGWAVVSQRLNNDASCGFDAAQSVVIKASSRGHGRAVVRLGSGGMPDCEALTAAGVPQGLVLGC